MNYIKEKLKYNSPYFQNLRKLSTMQNLIYPNYLDFNKAFDYYCIGKLILFVEAVVRFKL